MFRQCRLPQPSPIQPLSGVKFRFSSRPSHASMQCLCRPAWACFFLFLPISGFSQPPLSEWRRTGFLSPWVGHCPRICPQPAHTAPTGQATCFAGVASLPGSQNRTQALTGPNSFFLPRTSLPSPFRGRGWVSTFLGSPGLPCSFKTDSHWPNRAGIEPRWCPLPSSQNRTQGHTGASLYLLPFSPSLSRREVTVNYSSTRMSLGRRKYSPQWRFLL